MNDKHIDSELKSSPAMGERRARWGYGYQDKVATDRILGILREEVSSGASTFEGIRLADLEAGRVDDFVLVWKLSIEGNSIKWSGNHEPLRWGDLIGADGLIGELAAGYRRLCSKWTNKSVAVRLQTNRPASVEKHHAQLISTFSVAEFLTKYWRKGPSDCDPPDLTDAWSAIAKHVELTGAELTEFVSSCYFSLGMPEPPGAAEDTLDWRHYKEQFGRLHREISTWLTNTPHGEAIDREFLISAIGLRATRSGLIQRFPQPSIPYQKNQVAADQLRKLINFFEGGYIAIVGAAGIGKSTLVQDVLTDSAAPFFIPYYAFLPNSDGNRDRGEALTFFQDIVGRLDRMSTGRLSIGITDVMQGRDALRDHMRKASERYVLHGHKTILLVDGLDHVTREVNLQVPMLNELPPPNEVPDGFLIILSGQPQSFIPGTIPVSIATNVAKPERRIELSGLSRLEVHHLVAELSKPTTGQERDDLSNSCRGNPLILTYLLTHFEGSAEVTVAEAIEQGGGYVGFIDEYYQHRLAVPLQSGKVRHLLGLLCRAAPSIPVEWLQQWPQRDEIEDLYQRILAPFLRLSDGIIEFIHDSLISFLKSETRSRLPATDAAAEERAFHSSLADLCTGRPCSDRIGRSGIRHLLRAERHGDVVALLSSSWTREASREFVPYAHIRALIVMGLHASWSSNEFGQVLRLSLLDHEIEQKSSRTEAGTLADRLLGLDLVDLALEQIRSSGQLLVDEAEALTFARRLWTYGTRTGQDNLKMSARTLYHQSKPISLIYRTDPIDTRADHDHQAVLGSWSGTAPIFESTHVVAGEIQKLNFADTGVIDAKYTRNVRADLLFRALSCATEIGLDAQQCQPFLDAITELKLGGMRFEFLLRVARAVPHAVALEQLRDAYNHANTNYDVKLAYARFLFSQGITAEAKEIVERLSYMRIEPYSEKHAAGFTGITYSLWLRYLQESLGIPEGDVPGVQDDEEEVHARIEMAARKLGVLRASENAHTPTSEFDTEFRSLLLFYNQTVRFSSYSGRNKHVLVVSKTAVYREVIDVASTLGARAVLALKNAFIDITRGPAGDQFSGYHRRLFARMFFEEGVSSKGEAVELGMSVPDADDDDPAQRQETCLEIAGFLHSLGDKAAGRQWLRRASEVSAGAGSHKDYHMSFLADWLRPSISESTSDVLRLLEKFARTVQVAGGRGGSSAAETLLELLLKLDPFRAQGLAKEFVDREVLLVAKTVGALTTGAAEAGASCDLLSSLYCEVHSLIAPDDTSPAATAVLRACPLARKREVAELIMSAVRTNSLPSHRVEVARSLQDVLRTVGREVDLSRGLIKGRDDSSSNSLLYRQSSGDVDTRDKVACRLGDPDHRDQWNPNPSENGEFDWWAAIKRTEVRDLAHMEDLLAAFPLPTYREVDRLAWKSMCYSRFGQHKQAEALAEESVARARDGHWFARFDGAQKRTAYTALKRVDYHNGLNRAREQFGADLGSGKLSTLFFISEAHEVFESLEINWPAEAVRSAIEDYLDQVLTANEVVPPYDSLIRPTHRCSADEALCAFISNLLAFPVIDVGNAARRALARYVGAGGVGIVALLGSDFPLSPIQVEHLLAGVHVGSRESTFAVETLHHILLGLNRSESLAVRCIARRICEEHGFEWTEIRDLPPKPIILLPRDLDQDDEAGMRIRDNIDVAWELQSRITAFLERNGVDSLEARSEFEHIFLAVEAEYVWADDARLKRWMSQILAAHWLKPRVLIGREAAMRVVGRRALLGQLPRGVEEQYDGIYPIYDSSLELEQPMERPSEFTALDWTVVDGREDAWLKGENADRWSEYPDSVQGMHVLGERSWFVRPAWEWQREERYRGLLTELITGDKDWNILETQRELTYESYVAEYSQNEKQLVVFNAERQLAGPTYRWAAINAKFARSLGWRPSESTPFEWVDSSGKVMVKSVYWRDGWIWLKPPRFETLSEGWVVLATAEAVDAIREQARTARLHLWIERHSHGDKPYEGKWHLSKSL